MVARTILLRAISSICSPSGGASHGSEQSDTTNLCVTFLSSSADSASESNDEDTALGVVDEVEQYLAMGVVVSKVFIDVIQYWIGQKEQLPGHYCSIIWPWIFLELRQHRHRRNE
jgi:hypothetical protein